MAGSSERDIKGGRRGTEVVKKILGIERGGGEMNRGVGMIKGSRVGRIFL